MGKYSSKKVLHIGNNYSSGFNIKLCKKHGAYVVVGDTCPPHKNPYRKLADEVIQIDIDNLDEVIAYAKANSIDAITTNFSEPTYETGRILNEGIGNAYYHTAVQWQTFMNKVNFRNLCYKNKITAPKTYFTGTLDKFTKDIENKIVYPVIVKPCEGAGGRGISVCKERGQLNKALKKAQDKSRAPGIIIEEYVEGKEVVFTYVIQNGICRLVATSDKYVYRDSNDLTVLPEIYIYPCLDHDLYVEEVNDKVISMIKAEGLDNCTIFFQTIEKDKNFYFFEAGLRVEGTASYDMTRIYTGQNSCDFLYDYLLKVDTDYDVKLEDPKLHGHQTALFDIHLKKGYITKIEGLDYLKNSELIFLSNIYKKPKNTVKDDLLGAIFAGVGIKADDPDLLVKEIDNIKRHVKVKGIFNRNLIVNSFDEKELLHRK